MDDELAMMLVGIGVSTPVAVLGGIGISFITERAVRRNVLMAWSFLPVMLSFIGCAIWYFSIADEPVPYPPLFVLIIMVIVAPAAISMVITPVWAFAAFFSHNFARRWQERRC